MFRFDFKPIGGFDLFVSGRSHFLLSECSLSFNNAMITLTSARWSAHIVELASGLTIFKGVHMYFMFTMDTTFLSIKVAKCT